MNYGPEHGIMLIKKTKQKKKQKTKPKTNKIFIFIFFGFLIKRFVVIIFNKRFEIEKFVLNVRFVNK